MTGIAIVGQGYMGRTHAEAWSRLGHGDDIRYITAPGDREWSDVAARAAFTTHLDEVLFDPAVDRLSVCTPTPSHASIAIRALRAGKHVLLEKPIALSLDDAHEIESAAAAGDRVLMIAQVVRFFAGYEALAGVRDSGRIGEVRAVRASRVLATPTWAPWWPDEEQSGGVPVDFSIHDFDQANFFLGIPVAVRATRTAHEAPLETTIEYEAGGIAQVHSFPYLPQGSPFSCSLELIGSRGQAAYRMISGAPTDGAGSGVSELTISTVDGVERIPIADNDPYAREIEYFSACIASRTPPVRSTTASAIAALEVSLATRASLERGGQRVELS
ncbi:MAG TPA: Gfo/Idh/MocA family oxidoreductase [Pseudolysinimonas sp.]|nr:Gfo/Idh/MocA family oxidoreductase [Pseudolysinimonas sp.]